MSMENITDLSCREFAAQLAGESPIPGGGSAAAVCGALAAALGEMVASLTIGRKSYSAVEGEAMTRRAHLGDIRLGMLNAAEKDAASFEPLSRAYALPKDTPERAETLEKLLFAAAAAPMETMELCMKALPEIERMADIGSRLAVSDAGCAAALCRAALCAAALNVFANTRLMSDCNAAEELNVRVNAMLRIGCGMADRVFADVREKLG